MNTFFRKLGWMIRRGNKEAELQEEIQFHLDEESEERLADGLGREDARWAAKREPDHRPCRARSVEQPLNVGNRGHTARPVHADAVLHQVQNQQRRCGTLKRDGLEFGPWRRLHRVPIVKNIGGRKRCRERNHERRGQGSSTATQIPQV